MTVRLNPHVIFYHIEKCAGTSLHVMLYDYFKHIYLDDEIYIPEKNNYKHYCLDEKNFFEDNNFKVILGHISVNEVISDFTEHIKIICIRHPVDRMISHYYYFDYDKYNIPLHCFTKEQLDEYISHKKAILMRISGNTFDLVKALKNLRNINIILIFEKLEDDVIKLNNVLNEHFKVDAHLKITKQNARVEKISCEQLEKEKECLLNSGLLDDELFIYKYICDMNEDYRYNLKK